MICYFISIPTLNKLLTGEGYSSDEDELSQEEIAAAMAEIQPAKKMRYRLFFVGST